MTDLSWAEIKQQVHQRAILRCEYCQTSQKAMGQAMHVEHILPDGGDTLNNLCLACPNCNLSKAKATSAKDPETGNEVSLFNPREQVWDDLFVWHDDGKIIVGKTAAGRATVARLKMNQLRIVEARAIWIIAGIHPPT